MTHPRTINADPLLEAAGQLLTDALAGHPDYPAGTVVRLGQVMLVLDRGRIDLAVRDTADAPPIPVATVAVVPTDPAHSVLAQVDAATLARSIVTGAHD